MLPPHPIIDLADDNDLTDDESSEREDAELNERAQADDTIIDAGAQVDLNDKDWEPPQTVGVRDTAQSQYNLRPRENIIPPRRNLE